VINVDEKTAEGDGGGKRKRSEQERGGRACDYRGCRVPAGTHLIQLYEGSFAEHDKLD
jgi:hypothetical protein